MRAVMWMGAVLVLLGSVPQVRAAHSPPAPPVVTLSGPTFPVGDLTFTLPGKWQIEPVEGPGRGGQWRVPPLHGTGESGELVAFYFGPHLGGTAKENIEAWIGTMSDLEGRPAAAEQKTRQDGPFFVSQVVIFGTYNRCVSLPGVPPQPMANYGLLGAVVENPQGNIYWRFTGPEPLITANLPLFTKIIDSVKAATP